jgi:hypothetical protein
VEEGFEAVLSRKQRATPAVARIFDGEKEAKLIALCRAPLVANYTAKACPIPEPAPVIATTLLSNMQASPIHHATVRLPWPAGTRAQARCS